MKTRRLGLVAPAFGIIAWVAATGLLLAPRITSADTINGTGWKGTGGNSNFSNTGNWDSTAPNTAGTGERNLFFGQGWVNAGRGGSTTPNNDLTNWHGYRITFESITSPVSFTLSGNSFSLFDFNSTNPKIENLSSVVQNVNMAVTLGGTNGGGFAELDPTNGDLSMGSTVDLTGTTQLRVFGSTGGKTLTFNGIVSSSGGANSFALNSNNTVVFKAANTYSGDTFVNAGKLQFDSAANSNSSTIRIGDTSGTAAAEVDLNGATANSTLVARSGTSGTRTLAAINSTGTSTWAGNVFLDANLTTTASSGGTLAFSGATFDLKNQTLTVGGGGDTTISGALQNSTGSGKLTYNGSGTLTVSGNSNSYTGNTTISNGTLLVNNTSGTTGLGSGGTVNINSAGKLGGTGNAGSTSVSVNSGGTISAATPSAIGTLTTGAQTWNGGGKYAFKINVNDPGSQATAGTKSDELVMSGLNLAMSSGTPFTIAITSLLGAAGTAFSGTQNYSWLIAHSTAAITGTSFNTNLFTLDTSSFHANNYADSSNNTSSSGTFGISEVGSDFVVSYTAAAPEPTSFLLFAAPAMALLSSRRRRNREACQAG